jgi:ketol-acid reductoisomerase
MWYSVSDTAEHGGYTVGDQFESMVKEEMMGVLERVQDGSFAQAWIEENRAGRPNFNARRQTEHDLLIEKVGAELRDMMPFLDARNIKQGK